MLQLPGNAYTPRSPETNTRPPDTAGAKFKGSATFGGLTQADQSWRDRPARMSDEVCHAAVERLAGYVRRHGLTSVRVILHGGEPLLYGVPELCRLADDVRAALPAGCAVEVGLQTNAVLLYEAVVHRLRDHRIPVGVSVDGVESDHDRHRRTPSGRGSFAAVRAALDLLRRPENRAAYAGVLCTIAPDTDPNSLIREKPYVWSERKVGGKTKVIGTRPPEKKK